MNSSSTYVKRSESGWVVADNGNGTVLVEVRRDGSRITAKASGGMLELCRERRLVAITLTESGWVVSSAGFLEYDAASGKVVSPMPLAEAKAESRRIAAEYGSFNRESRQAG